MAHLFDFPELTPKQEVALACLMSTHSIKAAAEQAGVGLRTLHRWLKQEPFRDAYRAARRAALEQAGGLLQAMAGTAAATLLEIMQDPDASGATRVSACREALGFAINILQTEQFAERLDAIEATLEAKFSRERP